MRHFSVFDPADGGQAAGCGSAPVLALAAALACAVTLANVGPATAGTVVRGRVLLPSTIVATSAEGRRSRTPVEARDAVVYVTVVPGDDPRRLSGRAGRKDMQLERGDFTPRVLPVVSGSRVRFENHDRVYHNVIGVSAGGRFELGDLAPGARREQRFDRPGVVHLFCGLHPAAAGYVVVCPNWYFARAGASGEYALPPLPRGSYRIHAWHPRRGETRQTVEVTGRGLVALDLGW